jgi:hypothetical protein
LTGILTCLAIAQEPVVFQPSKLERFVNKAVAAAITRSGIGTLTSGRRSAEFRTIVVADGFARMEGVEVIYRDGSLTDTSYLEGRLLKEFEQSLVVSSVEMSKDPSAPCFESQFPGELDKTIPGNTLHVIQAGCYKELGKTALTMVFSRIGRVYFPEYRIEDIIHLLAAARRNLSPVPDGQFRIGQACRQPGRPGILVARAGKTAQLPAKKFDNAVLCCPSVARR